MTSDDGFVYSSYCIKHKGEDAKKPHLPHLGRLRKTCFFEWVIYAHGRFPKIKARYIKKINICPFL